MTRGFLRFLRGNTIALLALFIALGGTTYAAYSASAKQRRGEAAQEGTLSEQEHQGRRHRKVHKGNSGAARAERRAGRQGRYRRSGREG